MSDFSGASYLTERLWRVLCCGGSGGNISSWAVAKHVSSSVHSFAFLPLPLWTSSHPSSHSPSWVLLKLSERPSAPGSSQGRGGEIPLCHSVWWWWESTEVPLRFPLSPVKGSDANQLHTQQHKHSYVIVLVPARQLLNPPGWQACQSRSNLPASLPFTLTLSEFPSDLSGHISAASLSCASRLRAGLSHAGRLLLLGLGQVEHFLSTGVADRWSWPLLYFTLQWKDEEFDNIFLLWFHMLKCVSLNRAIVTVKYISNASFGLFHSSIEHKSLFLSTAMQWWYCTLYI